MPVSWAVVAVALGWLAAFALCTPAAGARARAGSARAPSGPPLLEPYAGAWSALGEESSSSAPPSQGDSLADNGLDSPLCAQSGALPAWARRNCQAGHFLASPYPTGNYAFDVNIDTGPSNWSNDASAVIQNLTQLGWMWLVMLTHGVIVALEWCYSLDLPSRQLLADVGSQLRGMASALTQPWMALALALASALAVHQGLIRRRVTQSIGQVFAALAMMAGGLGLMLEPAETVGSLQRWSDGAGIGVLAIAAAGTPARPQASLVSGLSEIFATVITGPWCYLEFGDVRWCEQPRSLDAGLRRAGLRVAKRLSSGEGCQDCLRVGGSQPAVAGPRLLRGAQTNGQLFLALPANKPDRNSAKTQGSLLNVLCGGAHSAKSCRGATAAQAEFRSETGTYSRAVGLLLIWPGALGMLLLFGFLAVRLLASGVATIGYLLMAPVIVLAPALGDHGRATFRSWAVRLFGAAVSKLVYSFLLGWALALNALLLELTTLGWWAQWLLISVFWWTAFLSRHHALGAFGPRFGSSAAKARRPHPRVLERGVGTSAALYATYTAGRLLACHGPTPTERPLGPPPRDPGATGGELSLAGGRRD